MRIVEINITHLGSTGKIMLNIAKCARNNGHNVWTFSPNNYNRIENIDLPVIEGHEYFGTQTENMLHHYVSKVTGFQGYFSLFGTRQLLKKFDEIKPNLIHFHNLHNKTINFPILFDYVKRNHIRTVWTLHDCWAFTGQCPYFTMVKCDRWKKGCHHCSQINVYPEALVDRTSFMWKKKKDWFCGIDDMTLVTPSKWLAELTRESFLKCYPVQVINNGIDLDIFKPINGDFREKNGLEDMFLLLGVAFDWGKRKGLDVFIRLAKNLDKRYRIVLVGTNELIDKQLPENIISIHRTNNQSELAQIYSEADLFVNPTREDNYPTVNLEALACGTPVLTFRTGGSLECLDATCGSIVECDDVEAMRLEIERIYTERSFSKEACVKRALDFAMEKKFKEYIELYEKDTTTV